VNHEPVFKKTATKPLPAGAKTIIRKGERLAACPPTETPR